MHYRPIQNSNSFALFDILVLLHIEGVLKVLLHIKKTQTNLNKIFQYSFI